MDIFVKRPVIAIVISLALLLAGISASLSIPVLQFPKLESSNLVVSTIYPGASADVVQGFITDPIERVAMTVPGVDYVDSRTTAGLSTVTVWLDLNENSTDALAELTSRLNQIQFELPFDALDPSIDVVRSDQANALFYLTVVNEGWSRSDLTDYLSRNVSPLLTGIDGVQRIGLDGGRSPAMRVWMDPLRLASVGIGADEVFAALRNNNVLSALGRTESDARQLNLLTNATLQSAEDFEDLIISNQGGALVRLRDVARVELGEDRGEDLSRIDDSATVFVSVWSVPGANAIEIGDAVYERLEAINATLPEGLGIEIAYDATVYMRHALTEILTTLVETIVLVGLVVLLLMGSPRSALVPLVTIPISILGAIAVILVLGFTLNLLTILAIVLSVGLVVDDAIVVVENVTRHIRAGRGRIEAALISSRELFAPIVAMTLTLAAVYAPIGFVSGLSGALFREFTFTLAVAVIISGVVAVTLSPIMSAYVSGKAGRESKGTQRVNRVLDRVRARYAKALDVAMAWRPQVLVFGAFLALLMVPFYLFSARELAPIEDQGGMLLFIEAPPNSRVQYTEEYMRDVVAVASEVPGFDNMWQILNPAGGFAGLEFVDYDERDFAVQDMRELVLQEMAGITGLRVLTGMPPALPTAGQFDVEMVVQGPGSYEELLQHAFPLVEAAFASGHFIFADTDLKISEDQVRLVLDHDRIADLGLNVQRVSDQLATMLSEQDVNRFNHNGKSYRVIPMVESFARDDPSALLDLQLTAPGGELIPVRTIASLERVTSPVSLGKFNQQRAFRILGGIHSGTTGEAALSALEAAAAELLPSEYTVDHAGISRALRKEGNSLVSVLLVSMFVVYLLLAIQFNSFRTPLVILLGSVPLALTAALLWSFLGLTTINVYAQIGFITLVGLVAKNGILITEFANQLQRQGVAKERAIREAAVVRLQPVLMTTLATVIGHFPLVLAAGAGAEVRNSIGIILVAGMAIGTAFTLFVLPCVYMLLGDSMHAKERRPARAELDLATEGA